MSNVTLLDGEGKKDAMRDNLRDVQKNLEVILAAQRVTAVITRRKYLELVEQGFTPDQALALCK